MHIVGFMSVCHQMHGGISGMPLCFSFPRWNGSVLLKKNHVYNLQQFKRYASFYSLRVTVHCKIKRVDLAPKMGPKRVSPVWHSLRVNSAPLKWGCFWHQFWGWIDPVVGAKLDHVKGRFEKYRGHFEIYRGQNSPQNFSPLTNGPFKKSQFSSNVGHFRSRGLFPLHADFPPYIQIMKIHHILYLSNTHLLGSRYCLCKNLLCYLILQLLRILIVV